MITFERAFKIVYESANGNILPNYLINDYVEDSMEYLHLIWNIEKESSISFPDSKILEFKTFGDIATYMAGVNEFGIPS